MHKRRPGMYQKFRSVGQLSGVPTGKSGDTGGWERGLAAVVVSGTGLTATGTDACLPLAMTDKLASK
jgi:hypothetical protein